MSRKQIFVFPKSLSSRLIIAFITVIIVTTIAAGLPAYLLTREALEKQAWARVVAGRRATLAVLNTEQTNMANLVFHTSQRPTLQRLVSGGDKAALEKYLSNYILGVGLDFILISDSTGKALARSPASLPALSLADPGSGYFYIERASEPRLVLAANQLIPVTSDPQVFVTIGKYLDEEFIKQLADETWFEQSIIINGQTVSTTLGEIVEEAGSDVLRQVFNQDETYYILLNTNHSQFYTAQLPIKDSKGDAIALFEVALPVGDLISAERNAMRILVLSTIFVISIGSTLAYLYAKRLTAPLKDLTYAAQQISKGDYLQPVPVPNEPYEISLLASTFEESRINTARNLENLFIEKTWSNTLIQSISEGIVAVDDIGRITTFNEGASRITGWKVEDAISQPINRILPLKDGQGTFMNRINPNGGQNEITVISKEAGEITLDVTAEKINYPNTRSEHTLLVLRDVTEEIAAQRIRSYFLGNISHEFRTPLSALKASVEFLVDEIDEMPMAEIVELLNSIHYSVTALQTLIDNLLESTSIEAGRFQIRCQLTDFNKVLSESVRIMKPLLNRRHQSLECHEPANMPLIKIDPTRLTQVMVNLLSNASKFSPMDEKIEINLQIMEKRILRVSVADHGPGISPLNRKNIFNRFVRLDTRDGTQYGVGLGLSVVKTIVEEHGGQVGVDEYPMGGSIFWFTIPMNGGIV